MPNIIVIGVEPSSLVNFRGDLLKSIVNHNFTVTTLSDPPTHAQRKDLEGLGVNSRYLDFSRGRLGVVSNFKILLKLVREYRIIKPDTVLAYSIKPVIWGGIAARFCRTDFFALITGLGFALQGESFKRQALTKLIIFLYKVSLKKSKAVIFQNVDNLNFFVKKGIVEPSKAYVVNGSGVNLKKYSSRIFPNSGINFLCISRLLGEKGLREYATAAKIVKSKFPDTEFDLIGPEDPSPDAIPLNEVDTWSDYINYKGSVNDVRPHIEGSHVYVLPSYHEGLPRSVLEAMSMGRPVITTNATGCKETVEDGINGFKVLPKSSEALAKKMIWFIKNSDQIRRMGIESRRMVENRFDVRKINKRMLEIMEIL